MKRKPSFADRVKAAKQARLNAAAAPNAGDNLTIQIIDAAGTVQMTANAPSYTPEFAPEIGPYLDIDGFVIDQNSNALFDYTITGTSAVLSINQNGDAYLAY